MRMNSERSFVLAILAVTLVAGAAALMMNNIARRMPLIIIVYMLVSVGGYFIAEMLNKEEEGGKKKKSASLMSDGHLTSDGRMLLWIVAILVFMLVLGLLPGCTLFTVLFYRFEAKKAWRDSIIFGALIWFLLWVTFTKALQAELYAGFLEWL